MTGYNRYILMFFDEYKPKDIMDRLNDEEIEYWALLELFIEHKGIKCNVNELYLEFKNDVDYKYIETILAIKFDMDLSTFYVPTSSKQAIMEFFVKRASNGVATLRSKYLDAGC